MVKQGSCVMMVCPLACCTGSGDGEAGKVCNDGLSIGVLQRCTGSGDGEAGTAAGGHTTPQHGPED